MSSPTDVHWRAAHRVLMYARDNADLSITLGSHNLTLSGHSDLDWAKKREYRWSTTGFLFCLGKSPVSLKSKQKPTIALLLTEAKYMAPTDTACQAIWWRTILVKLGILNLSLPTVIHYNNKGAGELARNPCLHSRSKHIDVKHHFICECLANSTVSLTQVPTLSMLAEVLTKPLKCLKHADNVKVLFKA